MQMYNFASVAGTVFSVYIDWAGTIQGLHYLNIFSVNIQHSDWPQHLNRSFQKKVSLAKVSCNLVLKPVEVCLRFGRYFVKMDFKKPCLRCYFQIILTRRDDQYKSLREYFLSILNFKRAVTFKVFILELSVNRQICLKLNFQAFRVITRVPCTAVFLRSLTSGFQYLKFYFLKYSSQN